jgi:hypothetical protein
VITAIPRGSGLLWLDTTPEVGPFQYLTPALRDKPASLVAIPADLPFPAMQTFEMTGALNDDDKLEGHADFSVRGDLEVVLRSAFDRLRKAQALRQSSQPRQFQLHFAGRQARQRHPSRHLPVHGLLQLRIHAPRP